MPLSLNTRILPSWLLSLWLVACLLNHQGVPFGEDFAKSSYLGGLELSPLPTDESMPVEGEETVESLSGSMGGVGEESVKNWLLTFFQSSAARVGLL